MQFIHQASPEESGVEFAAAFAEQPAHAPPLPQPAERAIEVQGAAGTDPDIIGQRAQPTEATRRGPPGREDENGREPALKDLGPDIDRSGAADNNPQVEFG